jgi:hypothetical protein
VVKPAEGVTDESGELFVFHLVRAGGSRIGGAVQVDLR